MNRIVLLGCAGSGKSTLARKLNERTGTPLICLDAIWQPHWTKADIPRFRVLVEEVHAGEAWISDGNFAQATFDIRLPRATLVVWLERSRLWCCWRVILRALKGDETHRLRELAKVLAFIWQFDRVNRTLIEKDRLVFGPQVPVRRLTNDVGIRAFLDAAGGSHADVLH